LSTVGVGSGTGDEGIAIFDDAELVCAVGRRIERATLALCMPDGASLVFG
jgi:hypothetical protein